MSTGVTLRLVGAEPSSAPIARRDAIARENASAATMSPLDARWIFAVDVAASLVGGRSAVLPPEGRRRLVTRAGELGLRAFDANLVIAVVQDAAREGRALTKETQERLVFVRAADENPARPGLLLGVASLAGFVVAWMLTRVIGS